MIFQSVNECSIDVNSFYKTHHSIRFLWPETAPHREERAEGFRINKDGVLEKYYGSKADVRIPDCVKVIGSGAFRDNRVTENIRVPESVKMIESGAMSYMDKLREVSLCGIRVLERYCFRGSDKLEHVIFPDCLEVIGEDCFAYCNSLEEIDLGSTNAVFKGRIAPMSQGPKRFVFPRNLKAIPFDAFYYCYRLKDVYIPSSVTEIGQYAFEGCKSLTSIVIPENVEVLNLNTFKSCDGLRTILLKSRNTRIVGEADKFFKACICYADEL